jgi:uncharacterized membrane protein YedE/YeeE
MNGARTTRLAMAAFGLALGFAVSSAGLSDWGEVHRMFTLGLPTGGPGGADLRLVAGFGGAVATAAAGFFLLARRDEIPVKAIRPGTVPGALLFGAGWAIAGACPAAALVQLGEGKAEALVTVSGILAGAWLHDRLRKRFGWARHSCID